MPRRRLALLGALWLTAAACASPVGAVRVDPVVAQRQLSRSATTTGEPSWPTRNHLAEHGLLEAFDTQPEAAIAELHRAMVATGGDSGLLFALAELSFLHGRAAKNPTFHLAAAVYAYAFLFPEESGVTVGRFDPRLRIAADLYNLALTGAFASKDRSEVVLRGGTFTLPFGPIEVAFDPASLRAGDRELYRFTPTEELEVHGLAMRYRWPGLGLPLRRRHSTHRSRETRPGPGGAAPPGPGDGLPADPRDPAGPRRGRPLAATLELHLASDGETVSIAGEPVPLEMDPSAALALTFADVPIVRLELSRVPGPAGRGHAAAARLGHAVPARARPVVFVHGTQSSVVRWAEMYNRLQGDPEIRRRFQFWFFQYDSGQPVALSALQLREALTAAVARLDPGVRTRPSAGWC